MDEYVDKFRREAEEWVYIGDMPESELERHARNLRREVTAVIAKRYPAAQLESYRKKLRLVL